MESKENQYELFSDFTAAGKDNALLIIENEVITYASPAYFNMMGYQRDAFFRKEQADIRDKVHPEDKDHLAKIISETLSNKRPVAHYTFREMTGYGHYILREDYAQFYYDNEGNHVRTYVICRDISEFPERKAYIDMMQREVHVLIAEDNRMNMMLVKELISQVFPHCIIYEASDGQQAVNGFIEHTPDLVLMDINMPEKDGYHASMDIRQQEKAPLHKVPIVAITARSQAGEKERCLEAGMNDYLPKPIDEKEFKEVIMMHVMPYLFSKYSVT